MGPLNNQPQYIAPTGGLDSKGPSIPSVFSTIFPYDPLIPRPSQWQSPGDLLKAPPDTVPAPDRRFNGVMLGEMRLENSGFSRGK